MPFPFSFFPISLSFPFSSLLPSFCRLPYIFFLPPLSFAFSHPFDPSSTLYSHTQHRYNTCVSRFSACIFIFPPSCLALHTLITHGFLHILYDAWPGLAYANVCKFIRFWIVSNYIPRGSYFRVLLCLQAAGVSLHQSAASHRWPITVCVRPLQCHQGYVCAPVISVVCPIMHGSLPPCSWQAGDTLVHYSSSVPSPQSSLPPSPCLSRFFLSLYFHLTLPPSLFFLTTPSLQVNAFHFLHPFASTVPSPHSLFLPQGVFPGPCLHCSFTILYLRHCSSSLLLPQCILTSSPSLHLFAFIAPSPHSPSSSLTMSSQVLSFTVFFLTAPPLLNHPNAFLLSINPFTFTVPSPHSFSSSLTISSQVLYFIVFSSYFSTLTVCSQVLSLTVLSPHALTSPSPCLLMQVLPLPFCFPSFYSSSLYSPSLAVHARSVKVPESSCFHSSFVLFSPNFSLLLQ